MLLDNIRLLAKKAGVSMAEVETKAGLGKKTIWRWAKVSPSADKLKRVSDYFGVTVDELLREYETTDNRRGNHEANKG